MKPLMLKFNGINSFAQEQTIDFKKLIDKGIFGIFGPTGSGKSTIIEAIMIALYGKMSRYSTNSIRECINSNSDKMYVIFKFSIKKDVGDVEYIVKRVYKIDKKGTLNQNISNFCKIENNNKSIIAESVKTVGEEIKKVIGIEYNDFIKSIVLPQGKFSEFLLLENTARRDMLERIFGLEKYGSELIKRFKTEYDKVKNNIENIEKQIVICGNISEGEIKKQKEIYYSEIEQIKLLKRDNKEKLEEKNKISILISYKNEYNELINNKKNLINKSKKINEYEIMLDNAIRADDVIEIINEVNVYSDKFNRKNGLLLKQQQEFENANNEFEEIKYKYKEFEDYKKINEPNFLLKKREIENVQGISIELESIIDLKDKKENKYNNDKSNFNELKSKLEEIKEKEENLKKSLKDIRNKKDNFIFDTEYKNNIEYAANIESRFFELRKSINSINEKILFKEKELKNKKNNKTKIEKEKSEIVESINNCNINIKRLEENKPNDLQTVLAKENDINIKEQKFDENKKIKKEYDNINKKLACLKEKNNEIEKNLKKCNEKINKNNDIIKDVNSQLEIAKNKNVIMLLVNSLEDGKPCPVCGSVSHDNPANITDELIGNLTELKNKLDSELETDIKSKQELENKLSSNYAFIESYSLRIENILNQIRNFDFDKEEKYIKKERENIENIKNIIEKWNNEKDSYTEKLYKLNMKLNKLEIDDIKNESDILNINNIINENKEQLKTQNNELTLLNDDLKLKRKQFKIDNFKNEYNKLKEKEKNRSLLEEKETKLVKDIEKNDLLFNNLNAEITSLNESIIKEKSELSVLKEKINEKEEKIFSVTNGKDIEEYKIEIESKIKKLKSDNKDLNDKMEHSKEKVNNISKNIIKLKTEIESIKSFAEEKKQLLNLKMTKNNFKEISEVEKAILSKDIQEKMKEDINKYKDDLKGIDKNIEHMEVKLKGIDINVIEDKFNNIEKQIKELENDIEQKNNENIERKANILKLEENFNSSKELNTLLEKEKHYLDLLSEIRKVVDAKKFVEFVAIKHLKYITYEASERLKYISNNRYELTLKDADFAIVD